MDGDESEDLLVCEQPADRERLENFGICSDRLSVDVSWAIYDFAAQIDMYTRPPIRRMARWLLMITGVAALIGCESLDSKLEMIPATRGVHGLTAEQRAAAANLPVYRHTLAEASVQRIGPVKGESCQITYDEGSRISEEHALSELRRATILAGGNAVTEVNCVNYGRHEGPRSCFRSIVCRGIAVQTAATDSN